MSLQSVLDELRRRPATGESIAIVDPATEETIGEFTDGGAQAVDEAVARARATFDSGVWHRKPAAERAEVLWRAADLIEDNAALLAEVHSREHGNAVCAGAHDHGHQRRDLPATPCRPLVLFHRRRWAGTGSARCALLSSSIGYTRTCAVKSTSPRSRASRARAAAKTPPALAPAIATRARSNPGRSASQRRAS